MGKKASETTNIIRENKNLHLEKRRKCIVLPVYLLIKENLFLKSCLSGSKLEPTSSYGRAYARRGLYEGGVHVD